MINKETAAKISFIAIAGGGKGVDDSLDDENANIGDPGDQSLCHTPKKKRKKVWRGKTIETNIKNISTTTMDVAYEVVVPPVIFFVCLNSEQ